MAGVCVPVNMSTVIMDYWFPRQMNIDKTANKSFALIPEQVERFHTQGFLGPFSLCSPEQMAERRTFIETIFKPDSQEGLPSMIAALNDAMQKGFGRHHDQRLIYDMITAPAIVEPLRAILGEDLLLWRSMFFVKEPGEKRIPWHQDYDGWPIEPYLVVSAWIAVDPATKENGCVQLLPGSHRHMFPLVPTPDDVLDGFPKMSDPSTFDDSGSIDMELEPGQFFIFNERLLHCSGPNRSAARRMGLAVRYIIPLVRILDPGDHAILVSGTDRMGFNKLAEPPAA